MDLSVVVPTLNGRVRLVRCLDALSDHAPGAEVIVVNGPSTDGTTGTVRERADVDVLVEIADRNVNVARNAGIEHARGEWIAFVSDEYSIESAWFAALAEASGATAADEPNSRLARVLPESLVGVAAGAADATRAAAARSKHLAVRACTGRQGDGGTDDAAKSKGAVRANDTGTDSVEAVETAAETTDNGTTDNDGTVNGDGTTDGDEATDNERARENDSEGEETTAEDDGTATDDRSDESGTDGQIEAEDPLVVVTGPIHRELTGGTTTQFAQSRSVAGRPVTYFNSDNAAVRRDALEATDGFDEYLDVGGARDLAHRLAAAGYAVTWAPGMCVRGEYGTDGTGHDARSSARSLSYRLIKNYGLRPAVARRVVERVAGGSLSGARGVIRGEVTPSQWFAGIRDVTVGTVLGTIDGLRARWRDRERHNPNGRSARTDRAVTVYDRR